MDPTAIGTSIINALEIPGIPTALSAPLSFGLLLVIEALLLFGLVKLSRSLAQTVLKVRFHKKYHIILSDAVSIRPSLALAGQGSVILRVPFWEHERANGARDKRRQSNRLIRPSSSLSISHFRIASDNPYPIYWLYKELTIRGNSFIEPRVLRRGSETCAEAECPRPASKPASQTAAVVYAHYVDHPTDFEEYCADTFRQQGYRAKTTPKSNDGGFDIDMIDPQGRRCIVECKCYNPSGESVGRDLVQKLVGANAIARAERIIFITTARFTDAAIEYAHSIPNPVELIDGSKLELLVRNAVVRPSNATDVPKQASIQLKAPLTWEDIEQQYPPDIASQK